MEVRCRTWLSVSGDRLNTARWLWTRLSGRCADVSKSYGKGEEDSQFVLPLLRSPSAIELSSHCGLGHLRQARPPSEGTRETCLTRTLRVIAEQPEHTRQVRAIVGALALGRRGFLEDRR
jgi:hypothetical protein